MAVNLSARQFENDDLAQMVARALRFSGLPAGQLELELTESILMQASSANHTLSQLKELGIRMALDDFGTGYSNLASLKHFPIDTLKIDPSFIQSIGTQGARGKDEALVSAVISLAHALNLTVTVEGIEGDHQLAFLRDHHCDYVQGFLLAHPQPADRLSGWLTEHVRGGRPYPDMPRAVPDA